MFVLTGRLFWIQVINSQAYSERNIDLIENSILQRSKVVTLDTGRGDFYDRHLEPLTGKVIYTLVIFPINVHSHENQQQIKALTRLLGVTMEQWNEFTDQIREPKLWKLSDQSTPIQLTSKQAKEIQSLDLTSIQVVPYKLRYSEPYVASHLLGFISQNPQRLREMYKERMLKGKISLNQNMGSAGLESTLDRFLQGVEKTSLSLFIDGKEQPLAGLNFRLHHPTNPFYPLKAITTLDKSIQNEIEILVDQMNLKNGTVVVLDVENADVAAMVSRPQFNPNHVLLSQGDWSNKALKATTPGSIFKTIVAAAALEEGLVHPHESFQCNGSLGKYNFSCWKKEGHGRITFEQAFAQSCNITFAKVMERMSSSKVEYYAKKLGLLQQVGWSSDRFLPEKHIFQFDSEEIGKIFASTTLQNDGGVRAQTAIGQRDVMISPLQAANLIVTLLHDGEVLSPRVVRELRYHNNRVHSVFKEQVLIPKHQGISRKTSRTILRWMEEVVTEGTGQAVQGASWKLAGKSGTAQIKLNEKEGLNHWFIGYGPVSKPRYAVAVMTQSNSKGNQHEATAVFREVMNILATY